MDIVSLHTKKCRNAKNGLSNFERFRARTIYALNYRIGFSLTSNIQAYNRKQKK